MSAKYAQEMILIPKPSEDQSGGQVTSDTMDQFWRLLVDQVTMAPHVDRMMKLLGDMKGLEGQALPSTVPGQGPNSSDYFRLQGQLKNIPAQPRETAPGAQAIRLYRLSCFPRLPEPVWAVLHPHVVRESIETTSRH